VLALIAIIAVLMSHGIPTRQPGTTPPPSTGRVANE
jgi:hypothetical protein